MDLAPVRLLADSILYVGYPGQSGGTAVVSGGCCRRLRRQRSSTTRDESYKWPATVQPSSAAESEHAETEQSCLDGTTSGRRLSAVPEEDEFSFLDGSDGNTGRSQPPSTRTDVEQAAPSPQQGGLRLHKAPAIGSGGGGVGSPSWRDGVPTVGAGGLASVGVERLCQLLEALADESTAAGDEAWVDGYKLAMRLAAIGAPKQRARDLCRVFGRLLPPVEVTLRAAGGLDATHHRQQLLSRGTAKLGGERAIPPTNSSL